MWINLKENNMLLLLWGLTCKPRKHEYMVQEPCALLLQRPDAVSNLSVIIMIIHTPEAMAKQIHMMTSSNGNIFPRYWPFVQGIHRSAVNSPHKGQLRGALMFSYICAWMNGWVNNGEAGDLRRHRARYDVTVMVWYTIMCSWFHVTSCWSRKLGCPLSQITCRRGHERKPYGISPCTKWPPVRRRYCQLHFREWKVLYFD